MFKRAMQILRYVLPIAGLAYVFYHIQAEKLIQDMANLSWPWACGAMAVNSVSYFCQSLRWLWFLPPSVALSTVQAVHVILAGQFVNEVLPMRLGELYKVYLVSSWTSADFISVFPTLIAVRTVDAIWSVIGLGVTTLFVPLPEDLVLGGYALGGILLLGAGAFFFAIVFKSQTLSRWSGGKSSGEGMIRRLKWTTGRVAMGFRRSIFTPLFVPAFIASLFFLVLQASAFWIMLRVYGLELSIWVGAVVFLIVHFGTIFPSTPGDIGVYQFLCVIGLALFGVEKTVAAGFSLVVYFLLKAPLWVAGFLVISREGMSLSQIEKEVGALRSKLRDREKD
jgi:uncharacterized membrane protein YbhN (UPF0104 family)